MRSGGPPPASLIPASDQWRSELLFLADRVEVGVQADDVNDEVGVSLAEQLTVSSFRA